MDPLLQSSGLQCCVLDYNRSLLVVDLTREQLCVQYAFLDEDARISFEFNEIQIQLGGNLTRQLLPDYEAYAERRKTIHEKFSADNGAALLERDVYKLDKFSRPLLLDTSNERVDVFGFQMKEIC